MISLLLGIPNNQPLLWTGRVASVYNFVRVAPPRVACRPQNVIRYPPTEPDMYWTYKSLPELTDLPQTERDRLWKLARKDPLRWRDAVVLLVLAAVVTVTFFVQDALPHSPKWLHFLLFAASYFATFKAVDLVLLARYRPVVRRLRDGG
ncbi:MAG TPA: hypothetical protein VGG19_16560 [Tepidisphaeraceae bacterium]|jgi:hypothetical protein